MVRTVLVLLLAAVPSADEIAARLADLGHEDPAVRREAVLALSEAPGEEVVAALTASVSDSERTVRDAALLVLARREEPSAERALREAFRRFAPEADALAGLLTAVGEAERTALAGEVVALVRKTTDARVFRAAVDALGGLRVPEAVGALADLLAAGGRGEGLAAEALPEVRESLAEATGLPFRSDETWREWWRNARGNYRGGPLDPAAGAAEFRSEGWRFRIAVSDPLRWALSRPAGAAARVLWRGSAEEAGFAWVDVAAHAVLEGEPRSLEEQAARVRETMERSLREVRDAEFGRPARLAGAKAIRHEAVGILDGGRVVRWRSLVAERNGIVYTVSGGFESGARDVVRRDFEAIVGSFRFLD